jgi:hypothetical protein
MWGKPVREREFFLFLQFWKLHISKNKTNSIYLSLPSISVLEIYWKKPKLSHLEICAQTAVPYGTVEKRAQIYAAAVRQPYGLYGSINAPFCLGKRAAVRPVQKINCCCTKSVPYGFLSCCCFASKSVPFFALEIVPLLC